jgi:hypothetical protein
VLGDDGGVWMEARRRSRRQYKEDRRLLRCDGTTSDTASLPLERSDKAPTPKDDRHRASNVIHAVGFERGNVPSRTVDSSRPVSVRICTLSLTVSSALSGLMSPHMEEVSMSYATSRNSAKKEDSKR